MLRESFCYREHKVIHDELPMSTGKLNAHIWYSPGYGTDICRKCFDKEVAGMVELVLKRFRDEPSRPTE